MLLFRQLLDHLLRQRRALRRQRDDACAGACRRRRRRGPPRRRRRAAPSRRRRRTARRRPAPCASGVVSRYEKSRRSSSPPSTAATGRCSVSHAKACGTRVKTSRRKGGQSGVGEAGRDKDTSRLEVDVGCTPRRAAAAAPSPRSSASFAGPGSTSRDAPERPPALLHHLEPDELEGVVLVLAGSAAAASRGTSSSAPRATRHGRAGSRAGRRPPRRERPPRPPRRRRAASRPARTSAGRRSAPRRRTRRRARAARPTRPTSTRSAGHSGDLDEHAAPVAGRARADDRAQRADDPPAAADHLADVVRARRAGRGRARRRAPRSRRAPRPGRRPARARGTRAARPLEVPMPCDLDQAGDGLGGLSALAEPVLAPSPRRARSSRARSAGCSGRRSREPPVPRRARVGRDDAVDRVLLGAHAGEPELDCHRQVTDGPTSLVGLPFLAAVRRASGATAPGSRRASHPASVQAGQGGILPLPIWPIIFSIIFRASRSWFTSWTVVPRAARRSGRGDGRRSCAAARARCGVIESTIASTRLSRFSSTSTSASWPMPGNHLHDPAGAGPCGAASSAPAGSRRT